MRPALAKVVLCAYLFLHGTTQAQERARPARIALLEINVVGLSPDVRARFLSALAQAFRSAGYEVVDAEAASRKLRDAGVAPGCTMGACLGEVGRVLGARRVVVGGIGGAGSNYDIRLTLLDTQKGSQLVQDAERCDVCTI